MSLMEGEVAQLNWSKDQGFRSLEFKHDWKGKY